MVGLESPGGKSWLPSLKEPLNSLVRWALVQGHTAGPRPGRDLSPGLVTHVLPTPLQTPRGLEGKRVVPVVKGGRA